MLIFENYHLHMWALTPTNFHENRKTFNFSGNFHLSLEVFIVDEKEKKVLCEKQKCLRMSTLATFHFSWLIIDNSLISYQRMLIFENYHLHMWALTPTNFHENRKTFNFSENFHLSLEVFIVDEKEKKYRSTGKNAWELILWPHFIFHD
jgi:hypothetical protein